MLQVDIACFKAYARRLLAQEIISGRDAKAIEQRLTENGIGFIRDLYALHGDFVQGLSKGVFIPSEKVKARFSFRDSRIPSFTRRILSKIFDPVSGVLLPVVNINDVRTCYQLYSCLKKHLPTGKLATDLEEKVWVDFKSNQKSVDFVTREYIQNIVAPKYPGMWPLIKKFIKEITDFPTPCEDSSLYKISFPPGTSFEGLDPLEANQWSYENLTLFQEELAFDGVIRLYNKGSQEETFPALQELVRYQMNRPIFGIPKFYNGKTMKKIEREARFSSVPKSHKGYRPISVCETELQTIQLTWLKVAYDHLPAELDLRDQSRMSDFTIKFWDLIGNFDMTAASDLLAEKLGEEAFEESKYRKFLFEDVKVNWITNSKTGERFQIRSALMGEGRTFYILSVFLHAVLKAAHELYMPKYLEEFMKENFPGVCWHANYGDDVLAILLNIVRSFLQDCGMKINDEKSFTTESFFKESCEGHFFKHPNWSVPLNIKGTYCPEEGVMKPREGETKPFLKTVDAAKLIAIAHKSFDHNPLFSEGLCDVIESYSDISLPKVAPNVGLFGRPSLNPDFDEAELHFTARVPEQNIDPRSHVFGLLRKIGTDTETSYVELTDHVKGHQEYVQMASKKPRVRIRDGVKALEISIFESVFFKYEWADPTLDWDHARRYQWYIGQMSSHEVFSEICCQEIERITRSIGNRHKVSLTVEQQRISALTGKKVLIA